MFISGQVRLPGRLNYCIDAQAVIISRTGKVVGIYFVLPCGVIIFFASPSEKNGVTRYCFGGAALRLLVPFMRLSGVFLLGFS